MKKSTFNKGILLSAAAASLLFLNACDKALTLDLNKEYANIDVVLPSPQPAGTINIDKEIESDIESLASANNFNIDKIESAKVKSITITINDTDPNPVTTAIVDQAKLSLSADNIAVLEIGSRGNNHTSATQIDLDAANADIAPFLKSNKFKVMATLTTNAPIDHDVPLNIKMACTFKVQPLK